MKHPGNAVLATILFAMPLLAWGYSNPIEGGTTETVTNEWIVSTPSLTVGSRTSGNSLIIADGGSVFTEYGAIGNDPGSLSNRVYITGPDSTLAVEKTFSVGRSGSANQLMVADGGRLDCSEMLIGNRYALSQDSSRNTASVTGAGSTITCKEYLYIGAYGSGNRLEVLDGGLVSSSVGFVGVYKGTGSSGNNSILVSGDGSVWSNKRDLVIGYYGSGNHLDVQDGGLIACSNAFVGGLTHNNSAVVSDFGSKLENRGDLAIGFAGDGNSLSIIDGGMVDGRDGFIGHEVGADRNHVDVLGAGSGWSNFGDLYIGYHGSESEMSIAKGGLVNNSIGYIGYALGANDNSVLVTSSGSVWYNRDALYLGGHKSGTNWVNGGTGNSLTVENGGWVLVGDVDTNILPGIGTSGGIIVGNASGTAEMIVANGSTVVSDQGVIGYEENERGTALVTGTGSVWSNASWITVGGGSGSSLTVADGGYVYGRDVGIEAGDGGGFIEVTGQGSVLEVGSTVTIGTFWSNNRLLITEGGVFTRQTPRSYLFDTLGYFSRSKSNSVVVAGMGSRWVMDTLVIGYGGSDNTVMVSDGGYVQSYGNIIGHKNTADRNKVLITGAGSRWDNESDLLVGWEGAFNSLEIDNGGLATNANGYIGYLFGSDQNSVSVSGLNSTWRNAADVYIGYLGSSNHLFVADGGRVENVNAYIGFETLTPAAPDLQPLISCGNEVLVTDVGSEWRSSGELHVGYGSSANALSITDGGRVENTDGYIGYGAMASNNSAVVSGSGSVWDNAGNLHVGYNGSGNTLRIEDGGQVYAGNSAIGYGETANGNRVVVSGEDSVWGHGWAVLRLGEPATPVFDWPVFTNLPPTGVFPPIDWPGLTNNPVLPWPPFTVFIIPTNSYATFGGSVSLSGNNTYFGGDASGGTLVITNAGSSWGGGVLTLDGNLELGSYLTNNLWSATNVGSFLNGAGMALSSGNQLVITDGGFIGGSGEFVLIGTNLLDMGSSLGGSGFWLNPTNLVVQGGTFTGELAVASTNNLISITNNMPPPVFALRIEANFGDLSIGRGGSDNTLEISNGALVANYNGIIGETSNAWNNAVSVVGTNSEWRNMRDLYIGGRMSQLSYMMEDGWFTPWIDGGRGNSLYVGDGGLVTVGRDMHNRNYSTVSVDPGGHILIASNYYQDATSVLRFGVETNAAGAPLNALVSVGGTAEFETGATLQYHSNVGVLSFDTFYTNLIVEANQLIVGGVTNANALDLEAINLDGSLVDVLLWEDDQDIYGLVGRRHLADSAGFDEGSQMAGLSKEIDDLSLLGNPEAVRQINLLNGMSSARQNAQLTQRYTQGSPTYMHRQGMLDGRKQIMAQSRTFQSDRHAEEATPEGAAGPHEAEQGLRGWMRGYGGWADRDGSGSSSGFDQSIYGTVVGIDKSYGNVLLGAAGGYARSDLTQDNHDSSDADTGFGILYGSVGTADWFGDLNFSYGRSHVDTHSGTALGGTGRFDADNYAVYVGGGKEFQLSNTGLLFTPEAALLVGYYGQESYNDGLMDVGTYDRWSYQSRIGAAFALPRQCGTAVLKPEVRAYWLHEFNADSDQIGYSLTGGTGRYTFGVQAPDEDVLEAGVGLGIAFSDRLEIVLDVDGQYSDRYEAITVSGRAVYDF
ncbi:MAG: autotransporter domain-containing protein [Kiritimatiellales bacterium]|nr:autotransporter domain-containing protein [Kiritimatiellales bacterium]MCF7863214.1 autotransporter domain-containing protein [Kiritimatiellales bacterium]